MKRKIRKYLSMLLTMACVFSSGMSVFAEEPDLTPQSAVTSVFFKFDPNGGTAESKDDLIGIIDSDKTLTEPVVTNGDSTLSGWTWTMGDLKSSDYWNFNKSVSENVNSDLPDEVLTLTAQWNNSTPTPDPVPKTYSPSFTASASELLVDSNNNPLKSAKDNFIFSLTYLSGDLSGLVAGNVAGFAGNDVSGEGGVSNVSVGIGLKDVSAGQSGIFELSENKGTDSAITYSDEKYYVKVIVKNDGTLDVKTYTTKDCTEEPILTIFQNMKTIQTPGTPDNSTFNICVTKQVLSADGSDITEEDLKNNSYTFALYGPFVTWDAYASYISLDENGNITDVHGTAIADTAKTDEKGNATFTIPVSAVKTFTEGNPFAFLIVEKNQTNGSIDYSNAKPYWIDGNNYAPDVKLSNVYHFGNKGTPVKDMLAVGFDKDLVTYEKLWQDTDPSVFINQYKAKVDVAFDPNQGNGSMATEEFYAGNEAQSLTANVYTRNGYTFTGWNTAANGSGKSFTDCYQLTKTDLDSLAINGSVTLYAQWKAVSSSEAPKSSSVNWTISKSKKASPTELDSTNKTTKVTLSLPSAESVSASDVVFLIDKSMSQENTSLIDAAKDMVGELAVEKNANIKAGVIEFSREVSVKLGLTQLTTSSVDTVKAAMDTGNESGTNILGAVQKGEEMLAADTAVKNANKYLILLTDGGSTYYSAADGTPMHLFENLHNQEIRMLSQYDTQLSGGKYTAAQYAAYNSDSVQALLDNGMLANGEKAAKSILGNVGHDYSDNESLKWDLPLTTDGTYQQSYSDGNVKFVTQLEKSFYLVGNELLKAKNTGYQMISVSWPYHASSQPQSQMLLCRAFMDWVKSNIGPGYVYDGTNAKEIMSSVKNDITYLIGEGQVTDVIGDNFDLVRDTDITKNPFTLTLAGTEVSSVNTGSNEWSFGTPDGNGVYPYVVTYVTGQNEKFIWKINVPVKDAEQLQLSYNLILTAAPTIAGTYTYPTNNSAELAYKSSDGKTGDPEDFEVPQVTYKVQEQQPSWQVSKSKKASPTSLDSTNKTTRVTLSLPSAEYPAKADVVFLLDKSMSQENSSLINEAKNMIDALVAESNTDIKVGVIKFAKDIKGKLELTQLTSSSAQTIKDAFDTTHSSGTNILAAVKSGEEMLAGDSAVEASNKYIILMTDGGSTYYSDLNGTPMRLCTKNSNGNIEVVSQGDAYLNQRYNEATFDSYSKDKVQQLIDSGILADGAQGDLNILGNVGPAYSDNDDSSSFSGTYQLKYPENANYITQLEKSFYLVGKELQKAKSTGYHVISVSWPYHPEIDNGKSMTKLCSTFMDWTSTVGVHYFYNNNAKEIMNNVEHDIIYTIGNGTVTDEIGKNFDLITNGEDSPFTLSLAGTVLSVKKTDTNQWSFGTPESTGKYPYVVTYTPGTDEQFTWQINVPVKNAEKLQLSYDLLLTAAPTAAGTYTYPTNESAILAYTSSDGQIKGSEEFEVPHVTYTVSGGQETTTSGGSDYVPADKYPAVIDPPVQKLLGGDTPDTAATFTFALKADNPKFPMPSGSSNGVKMMTITGTGSGEFGKIAYYQPGTYTYTCYEVNNGIAGYTYDTSTFTMKVVVVDAGDRLLATRTIVRSDGNAADSFAFGNWYTKTAAAPAVNNTQVSNPEVPKTADNLPLYLFILMFAAGSFGIITLSVAIFQKSKNESIGK